MDSSNLMLDLTSSETYMVVICHHTFRDQISMETSHPTPHKISLGTSHKGLDLVSLEASHLHQHHQVSLETIHQIWHQISLEINPPPQSPLNLEINLPLLHHLETSHPTRGQNSPAARWSHWCPVQSSMDQVEPPPCHLPEQGWTLPEIQTARRRRRVAKVGRHFSEISPE